MSIRRRTLLTCLIAFCAACDGGRLGGPVGTTGGSTGRTGPATLPGLVGTWRRVLYFFAEDGSAASNETTWRFNGDGSAWRLFVTRNFSAGIADAQTIDARWEALPQAVRVTFLPPSSGTFDFSVRITADTLYLASQAYVRIAR